LAFTSYGDGIKGYGRQKEPYGNLPRAEYAVSFLPKIKIEVAVASDQVDKTIRRHHGSGKKPDRSATARSSSSTSTSGFASAPARQMPRHSDFRAQPFSNQE